MATKTSFSLENKSMQWATLLLLALIWGSSFLFMKRGLIAFTGDEVAAIRISLASLALAPIAFRNLHFLDEKSRLWILASGIFGNMAPAFLFAYAQTKIDSGMAGMLNALTPLFTLIIGGLFFRSSIGWLRTVGVLIGLLGSVSIIYVSKSNVGTGSFIYSFLVVLATLCYGISVNVLKAKLSHIRSKHIASLALFLVGPPCILYLFIFTDFTPKIVTTQGLESFGYLAILSLVGTAFSGIIFNELIKYTSSIFASSVTYLIPIVAVIIGVLDGEIFTLIQLLLFCIVLFGVYLSSKSK